MKTRIECFKPALDDSLLEKNNFFEMHPLDGGGSFIQQEILHSTDDLVITENILRKNALGDFGPLEEIDFLKFEHWSTIEKSCWINRMYFIVPLARCAKITCNRSLACKVRQILMRFAEMYQGPSTREEAVQLHKDVLYARDHDYNAKGFDFDGPISYQWFDFQVGSRIIHILYALYFLREMEVFSEEDLAVLDELLLSHGRNIYWVETAVPLKRGNHQALRAMALLLAGIYFRDLPEAVQWQKHGAKMCEFHILHDFLEDGMLIDMSPSYHFFESWVARDMLLLGKQAGIDFAPEAGERTQKAFEVCRALCMADGCCAAVNDAYSFDLKAYLDTLPAGKMMEGSFTLSRSGMAFYQDRREGISLMLDSSPLVNPLAHYHGGKQALLLYFGNQPFLYDSGCCSYDDPDFSSWYKQPQAHASLLLDGKGDGVLQGRYQWLCAAECKLGNWENDRISSVQTSEAPHWEGVVWTRSVTVQDHGKAVLVEDAVSFPGEKELTFLFTLHPDVKVERQGRTALLRSGMECVIVRFECDFEIRESLGYVNFTKVPARQLVCTLCSSGDIRLLTRFEWQH